MAYKFTWTEEQSALLDRLIDECDDGKFKQMQEKEGQKNHLYLKR